MSTPQINAAKLAYRNECALALHYIDRIFLLQEQYEIAEKENDGAPQRELDAAQITEAAANFGCLIDVAERARETGLVSLEELAFTDKIATPGGVYIDPVYGVGDPED